MNFKWDVKNYLEENTIKILYDIDNLTNKEIMNTQINDWVKYFYEKGKIINLKLIFEKEIIREAENTDVYKNENIEETYKATALLYDIPCEGIKEILMCINFIKNDFNLQHYEIIDAHLYYRVNIIEGEQDKEEIKKIINKVKDNFQSAFNHINNDINSYNSNLKKIIKNKVEKKINDKKNIMNIIRELNIQVKERDTPLFEVPMEKKPSPIKPVPSKDQAVNIYKLSIDNYDHILNVMKNMSLVIERNPEAFRTLKEPDIRTHFLLQLNGHYEGMATGETFNKNGKADIVIRYEGQNIFIGECKFWKTKKVFSEAIDQLFGYTTCHDFKAAIIIFTRNTTPSKIKTFVEEIIKERKEFKEQLTINDPYDTRFILKHPDDEDQEITLAIQIYNIPPKNKIYEETNDLPPSTA